MNQPSLTAKEYLSQAFRIDLRIRSKIEQVQSLRDLAEKATVTFSDMPSSGTRNIDRMEDIIAKMVDLESEIKADIDGLLELKSEIMSVINLVDGPDSRTILELRYLCFKSWEQISVELFYDIRHTHRLHSQALRKVDAIRRKCHEMS